MPPMPAAALAPPDLLTPFTASAALLGRARVLFERRDVRQRRVDQVEIGKLVRQQRSHRRGPAY